MKNEKMKKKEKQANEEEMIILIMNVFFFYCFFWNRQGIKRNCSNVQNVNEQKTINEI